MPLISQVGKRKWKVRLTVLGIGIFLWIGVAIHMFPVYWMMSSSLKPATEIFIFPPTLFPRQPLWDIYIQLFRGLRGGLPQPLWLYVKNSAIISATTIVIQIPITALTAYALSKLHSPKWNRFLFLFFVATLFVPAELTFVPNYLILRSFPFFSETSLPHINFINTYWAVILPSVAWAFPILLFKGHFDSIPDELINAARLDGASEMRIMGKIILPISKPIFAVVAYFTFNSAWNAFLWPLIVLKNQYLLPLSVEIYLYMRGMETSTTGADPRYLYHGWNAMMALSVVQSIPLVIVFIVLRESLMKGIKLRGFK